MERHIFDGLKECSAKDAWKLVKNIVTIQLIGDAAEPVPFPDDAESYSVLSVVVKNKPGLSERLKGARTTVHIAGTLPDMALAEDGTRPSLQYQQEEDDDEFNQNYAYSYMDMRKGNRKSIDVRVRGCFRRTVKMNPSQMLWLERAGQDVQKVNKIYVITTAYCAKEFQVTASIDSRVDRIVLEGRDFPVAFLCDKYRVEENGLLQLYRPANPYRARSPLHMSRPGSFIRRSESGRFNSKWERGASVRNLSDPPDVPEGQKPARRNPTDPLPELPGTTTAEQRSKMPQPALPGK